MSPTVCPLPNRRERAYLSAFKIAADPREHSAAGRPDRGSAPCTIVARGAARCGGRMVVRRISPRPRRSSTMAESVDLRGGAARSVDPGGGCGHPGAAERIGARLFDPTRAVMARARAATRRISDRVEQAAAAGDLQYQFNTLFQMRRKAAALEGKRLDYGHVPPAVRGGTGARRRPPYRRRSGRRARRGGDDVRQP